MVLLNAVASHFGLAIVVIFALLTLSNGEANHKRLKTKQCDPNRNEYYHRQMGRCKKCDKCPEGYGIESDWTFEMHPVYGALGCRKCKPCIEGETFRRKASFQPCKECRNCTADYRSETRPCTASKNAKCGAIRQQIIMSETDQKPANKFTRQTQHEDLLHGKNVFYFTAIIVIIATLPVALFLIAKRRKTQRRVPGVEGNYPMFDRRERTNQNNGDLAEDSSLIPDAPMRYVCNREVTGQAEACSVPIPEGGDGNTEVIRQSEAYSVPIPQGGDDLTEDASLTQELQEIDAFPRPSSDVITDEECGIIATALAKDGLHRIFAPRLGIDRREVETLEYENPGNEEVLAYHILITWKEKNGRNATKAVLRKISQQVKNPPDLDILLNP